jgi:hypothetical protein
VVVLVAGACVALDVGDAVEDLVQCRGQALVHADRVVAFHQVRAVSVAEHERFEFAVLDPGEHGRVGDLVAVQVQDGQDRAVRDRVEELVGVPRCREWTGLGLAVTDDAGHDEIRVVQGRPERVGERVPQFATLVDRSGRLRCDVARDATGERELAEQLGHAGLILAEQRVDLAVRALQPYVRDQPWTTVAGSGHVDDLAAAGADDAVQMGVEQVQPGCGAPVAQQPRLDVLGPQRLAQQRVVHQVDLAHRQVVGGAPMPVQPRQLLR